MEFQFSTFKSESELEEVVRLIETDLSEPYSVFTYRYFLHQWPAQCHLCRMGPNLVGVIVCKLEPHRKKTFRGYIGMLAVKEEFRKRGLGSKLVQMAIVSLKEAGAEEIVLETEITNGAAMNLYQNLGFVKEKKLERYYLNGEDAYRLKFWIQ